MAHPRSKYKIHTNHNSAKGQRWKIKLRNFLFSKEKLGLFVVDKNYINISGRSVWTFTMASRRGAIVNAHTDKTRLFHEIEQLERSVPKVYEYLLAE